MSDFRTLETFVDRGLSEPFIRQIRFPRFRNLASGSTLEFTYPITALIGPNGTNKSTILRALQACPNQHNIGDYWFDTSLDRIDDAGSQNPHRYIHSYAAPSGQAAEVIKTRVGKAERGLDYFETRAPRKSDGMQEMPIFSDPKDAALRNITRWKPIEKNVVYLDFRQELPAYDIYMSFNWSSEKRNDPTSKKKRIRSRSPHISRALEELSAEHVYHTKNRIIEQAEELSAKELQAVSNILGRNYTKIRLVRHSYFGPEGFTAILHTEMRKYSEAYAGSGEFAAIMLVREVSRAPERALVLLDEPETSLHPRAQRKLMEFIAHECVRKRHQVVLATHSPAIVEDLPNNARKLIDISPGTGFVEIVAQEASSAQAFSRIGAEFSPGTIIVEDELARGFVLRAARSKGEDFLASLNVIVVPGGAETLTHRVAPVEARLGTECAIILDGDKRPLSPYKPVLHPDDIHDSELENELEKFGLTAKSLLMSGGNDDKARLKFEALRTTYSWMHAHVGFLPSFSSPDQLLLKLCGKPTSRVPKQAWDDLTRDEVGKLPSEVVSAKERLGTQQRALATIPLDHPRFAEILSEIERALPGY